MATLHCLGDYRRKAKAVFFSRTELNQLLSLYSRQVMRGEWRDYAIDQRENAAVFSVFRHTQERPLYTIVKFAPGAGRHGDFAVSERPAAPRQRSHDCRGSPHSPEVPSRHAGGGARELPLSGA